MDGLKEWKYRCSSAFQRGAGICSAAFLLYGAAAQRRRFRCRVPGCLRTAVLSRAGIPADAGIVHRGCDVSVFDVYESEIVVRRFDFRAGKISALRTAFFCVLSGIELRMEMR